MSPESEPGPLDEQLLKLRPGVLKKLAAKFEADPAGTQEQLNGAVQRALEKSVKSAVRQLKRDAPSMLVERRAYRDGFERRRWPR